MFGNLTVEFSICLTFFHMPEADFATVGGGGGEGDWHQGFIKELKQQRRRRLRKLVLKSEFALLQTLSSKGMCQSSGKKKKVVVLCFRPRQNMNLSTLTLQERQKGLGIRHQGFIKELKQQRRRRLRKLVLKSEFALLQTLSSKGMCQSSGKKKKVVVLCFRPRQNMNLSTLTLQERQKNVQKKRDAHARLLFY